MSKKGLITLLVSLFPFFGCGVSQKPEEKETKPLETIVESDGEPILKSDINAKENRKSTHTKNYIFVAEPVNAGQSAVIKAMESITRKDKDPIEKIVLYEDGKKIAENASILLEKEVIKTTPCKHSYKAELHTKSGIVFETEPIEITYTGTKIDFTPSVDLILPRTEAGKATIITVDTRDIGDNRGIKRISLFEDGKEIDIVENSHLFYKIIECTSAQEHDYHVEVEDNGGHVVKSKTITVSYKGEAFPPEINWANANPENAGKTAKLYFEADDEKNCDKLSGISKLILYEDGNKIYETKDKYVIHIVTHDNPGKHTYHVEAFNKNGKKSVSKQIEVSFTGQDLAPELRFWNVHYDSEKNIASIFAEAKDEKNFHKNAGIQKIVLYENGKPIATTGNNFLSKKLSRASGEYRYFAEVTNNSGIVARTKDEVVSYKAE